MKILILNGPNLNLTGKREEAVYGRESFDKIIPWLQKKFPDDELEYFQTNMEGEIVTRLQTAQEDGYKGIVINPGAYSHYSIAIHDALLIPLIPKVEVHLSHVHARDRMRHELLTAKACDGLIAGLGKESYRLAIEYLRSQVSTKIGFKH